MTIMMSFLYILIHPQLCIYASSCRQLPNRKFTHTFPNLTNKHKHVQLWETLSVSHNRHNNSRNSMGPIVNGGVEIFLRESQTETVTVRLKFFSMKSCEMKKHLFTMVLSRATSPICIFSWTYHF